LLVDLLGLLFGEQDFLEDILEFFDGSLFVAKHLPLVDPKEELDIETINVVQ